MGLDSLFLARTYPNNLFVWMNFFGLVFGKLRSAGARNEEDSPGSKF